MYYGWRAPALRVTSLAALVVSAALTADHLHPERAFCPMAEACDKARSSALGAILGVPTSVIGMAAFGGLFLLTLLPVVWGRRLLRPAGIVAAVCGAGLFAFQALALQSYCPLCLVADAAGLAAGAIVIAWPKPPVRRSGKPLPSEPLEHRLRWTALAMVAVAAPFLWPRDVRPSWVPVEDAAALVDADPVLPETVEDETPARVEPDAPLHENDPGRGLPPPPPPTAMPWVAPPDTGSRGPSPAAIPPAPPPPPPPSPAQKPAGSPPPRTPAAPPPRAAPAPRASAPVASVAIVEYVNAFCPHCRATRTRLDRVIAESRVPVRRRRISVWASAQAPLWARVCAAAEAQGLSDRVFAELELAGGDSPREVWAAARRAGADVDALAAVVQSPDVDARLERDRRIFSAARLEGLPTIDIGRRRLMGEQSDEELRDALTAARR